MSLITWLDHLDKIAFTIIHRDCSASWLDDFMLLLRDPYVWIPLYGFMLYWALRRERSAGIKFICLTIICFAVTDFTSASILKPYFERLRPCYDADMSVIIRGIIGCGGKYSFPSSHAANHFGLATFWYGTVYLLTGQKWHWLWLWALLICFAQVYIGKHFPLDIAGGALLGFVVGWGLSKVFETWIKPHSNKYLNNPSLSLP
jgi:membrane-associated phospholipid phosphatase